MSLAEHPDRLRWNGRYASGYIASFAPHPLAVAALSMELPGGPVADLAFSEPSGTPAWKTLPAWAVVATGDKAAGADVIRSMAQRAGASTTEVQGSHVIMISQPQAVAEVIVEAAKFVSQPDRGYRYAKI